jgi:rubredoxin
MSKYQCTVCGFIYNSKIGDPDRGIAPNTPFEELPDDWVCPQCSSPKDKYVKM